VLGVLIRGLVLLLLVVGAIMVGIVALLRHTRDELPSDCPAGQTCVTTNSVPAGG
jgi:hypothetical protein